MKKPKQKPGYSSKDLSEERFLHIISRSADGILIVDEGGIIRFVNPAAEEIFCRKSGDLLGNEFGFPIVAGEKTELNILCGSDGKNIVEMRVTQIEWDGKEAYLAALRDISDRKATEIRMEQLMKDLARSNEELAQFAYAVSHDLQAPLRAVSGFTRLLAEQYRSRLDENADMYLDKIDKAAERMHQMISDILAYSKVGSSAIVASHCDLGACLAHATENLLVAIKDSGAIITHEPLPVVKADKTQMTLLFQNLLGNAIKFCKESPRIHVSASNNGADWLCSVRDNGIGIDPKQAQRLFAIFQRLHTRDEYEGTGIGLAICKKIVERHGGHIWIESEFGKGTTFFFTIPSDSKAVCKSW